jgi:hypothetical protein
MNKETEKEDARRSSLGVRKRQSAEGRGRRKMDNDHMDNESV